MNRYAEHQWLAALLLLVTALFVSAGLPLSPRWRRRFRWGAIVLFLLATAAVLVEIAWWLRGGKL